MPQPQAQVYVNWGRMVAECGQPGCHDAREVEIGQKAMQCILGHVNSLTWPQNMPAIMAALAERTSDKRKNWLPAGHPLARSGGLPAGETPDELRAETAAGEAADAQAVAARRIDLIAQLRELGSDDDIIRDLRKAT